MDVREALRSFERGIYQRVRRREATDAVGVPPVPWHLDTLARHRYCLLITHRRDGRGVPTPVWFAVVDDGIVLRSGATDAKVRRIRARPDVLVCPCTLRGRPLGAPMPGRARIITGEDERRAERALRARYGPGRRAYDVLRVPLLDAVHIRVEAGDARPGRTGT